MKRYAPRTLPLASIPPSSRAPNFVEAVLQEVTRLGGKEQIERWKRILLRDTSLE